MRRNLLVAGAAALALTLGLGLAQPASALTSSQHKKVHAWSLKIKSTYIQTANDLETFGKAASAENLSAIPGDATAVQNDVRKLERLPQPPVGSIAGPYSTFLADLDTAMSDYIQGVNGDQVDLIDAGTAQLNNATAALAVMNGRLPGGRF